jgi:hypothetical protein
MCRTRLLTTLIALSCATAIPPTAHGSGLNIGWDDCAGVGGAASNKYGTASFSCNTNSSAPGVTSAIVGSYSLPGSISGFWGVEVSMTMRSAAFPIAAWWDFTNYPAPTGCRVGELGYTFRSAATSCYDWPGSAPVAGTMTFEAGVGGPTRADIRLSGSYASGAPQPVVAGNEYVALVLTIGNAKTVGAGSCEGCASPVCFLFTKLVLVQSPAAPVPLTLTTPDQLNYITWNDAANVLPCYGTPIQRSTWGQVKGLYRE